MRTILNFPLGISIEHLFPNICSGYRTSVRRTFVRQTSVRRTSVRGELSEIVRFARLATERSGGNSA